MLGLSCKHTGSLAVAWGISVPWPGVEPGPLHWVKIVKIYLGLALVLLWAVWGQFIFR